MVRPSNPRHTRPENSLPGFFNNTELMRLRHLSLRVAFTSCVVHLFLFCIFISYFFFNMLKQSSIWFNGYFFCCDMLSVYWLVKHSVRGRNGRGYHPLEARGGGGRDCICVFMVHLRGHTTRSYSLNYHAKLITFAKAFA